MYPNVNAEMARHNITQAMLADEINVTKSTMSLKLSGKSPITLDEAFKIKDALMTRLTIDALFTKRI